MITFFLKNKILENENELKIKNKNKSIIEINNSFMKKIFITLFDVIIEYLFFEIKPTKNINILLNAEKIKKNIILYSIFMKKQFP